MAVVNTLALWYTFRVHPVFGSTVDHYEHMLVYKGCTCTKCTLAGSALIYIRLIHVHGVPL